MSKREEIKKKQQLQASLQVSFGRVDAKVMSWMGKGGPTATEKDETRTFESLPIISQGKGLSFGEDDDDEEEDVVTVRDFVKPKSKVDKIVKSKKRVESNSLRALKNKLRDTQRQKVRQNSAHPQKGKPQQQRHRKEEEDASDSDDSSSDEDVPKRVAKKVAKGKRPF